jgi:hypothetical protein
MGLPELRMDAGPGPDARLTSILRGWYDPDSAGFDLAPAAVQVRPVDGDAAPGRPRAWGDPEASPTAVSSRGSSAVASR